MQSIRKSACVAVTKNFNRTVTVNSAISTENAQSKPWTSIPGPKPWPIVGQLPHFLPGGMLADPIKMPEVLYEKFGPIVKFEGKFGSPTLIFLLDAEASAQILRNENWMPARPGFASFEHYRKRKNKNNPDEPTGLLTDHGEAWRKFRTTVNPILLHTKTIKLYSKILEEVAEDMVTRMKHLRKPDNTIDGKLDIEMNLWALESIGVVALGGRLNCFDPNLPEDSPARRLIQTVHDIFKMADKLDFKPSLWRYIGTPNYYKAMKCYEDQTNLSRYFINQAREQYKTKDHKSNDEKGILEKLLEIDENVATIMAGDMLLAGVDTAANTMLATFYLLAKNPEKQSKLREEILSRSEQKPYLKACIKESLRVKPVVSGNLRATSKEYDILGYRIPKDMYVTFGHQFLSISEDHFPRAKEYIPERWLVDKTDPLHYRNAHPFAYNPFGFGVRSCIGRRIAELEIETFLSKTIENFEIEWLGGELNVRPASLNYIVEPFNFIFKDV
ncbi:cytochrome P450 CYP12A2 [Pieris rapae]|uniref:cytochrome P450 CYP12A2 n=1 Tax=Pieris rapae TaxID=64459 RepID=UPI001E27C1C5|nr:cytochrome P450 CYP12A2 [Pieris rapae]XP_045488162.1 cytochrome P450 CYP12A2 [Pieris rapae]